MTEWLTIWLPERMTYWLTYLLANNRDNSYKWGNSDNIENTDNCDHSDTRDMCIPGMAHISLEMCVPG